MEKESHKSNRNYKYKDGLKLVSRNKNKPSEISF